MYFKKEWFVPELNEKVVLQRVKAICTKCSASGHEVLTFGLKSHYDADDASAVFFWCSCGHKWIVEPRPFVEKGVCRHGVFVGGMGADIMCGRCEVAGADEEVE